MLMDVAKKLPITEAQLMSTKIEGVKHMKKDFGKFLIKKVRDFLECELSMLSNMMMGLGA